CSSDLRAGEVGADDAPDVQYALRLVDAVIEYPGARRNSGFRAVDGVSLDIEPGEVVGLVGESGSGKSTIGKAAVGLVGLHSGSLSVGGVDITKMSARDLRPVRRRIGIVFQDPGSSLNPRWPIGQSIAEPMLLHTEMDRTQRDRKIGRANVCT